MAEKGLAARDGAGRSAILYALPDERQYLRRGFSTLNILRDGDTAIIEPEPALPSMERAPVLLRIGVGPRNAYENTCLLLNSGRQIRAVIVVGFAGGLEAGQAPGSVAVSETVTDLASGRDYKANPALFAAAAKVRINNVRVSCGLVASTDRVLVHAAEKRELARGTRAIAIDMESAGAAAAATEHGMPWLAVRVITDGVDDDLPFDFNADAFQAHGDPYGGVDRGSIVANALRNPWKIPALIRLGIRSSLAARNLGAFLHALLPNLPDL